MRSENQYQVQWKCSSTHVSSSSLTLTQSIRLSLCHWPPVWVNECVHEWVRNKYNVPFVCFLRHPIRVENLCTGHIIFSVRFRSCSFLAHIIDTIHMSPTSQVHYKNVHDIIIEYTCSDRNGSGSGSSNSSNRDKPHHSICLIQFRYIFGLYVDSVDIRYVYVTIFIWFVFRFRFVLSFRTLSFTRSCPVVQSFSHSASENVSSTLTHWRTRHS